VLGNPQYLRVSRAGDRTFEARTQGLQRDGDVVAQM
jgi:hypothetical protein